jgi:hypothetical protein
VATDGFKWLSVAGFATYGSRLPQMAHEGYMASDCFVWLLIWLYGYIWLYTALIATFAEYGSYGPKTFQDGQYGSLWPIGVYAAIYGSMWLQMDLNGSQLPVLLHMVQDCNGWLMKAIWLMIASYGS